MTSVLICDDSSMARKQLARTLTAVWGVEPEFAADGAEALARMRAEAVDLVFLDLTMPVMDGYQTLAALRAEGLGPKIVVVSGDVQPDARRRVLELGALEFIRKPVDSAILESVLGRLGVRRAARAALPAPLEVELRDCYREIANVATGRAADLLARLLGAFVVLPVPNVNFLEAGELSMALTASKQHDSLSVVCQGFTGSGIAGEALLLFDDASFPDMAGLMRHDGDLDDRGELELLLDVSNVLIGACLRGVAEQLDVRFSQSHPVVLGRHGHLGDLVEPVSSGAGRVLAIEMGYRIEDYRINCDLLLLLTEDSLASLNQRIGYLLEAWP